MQASRHRLLVLGTVLAVLAGCSSNPCVNVGQSAMTVAVSAQAAMKTVNVYYQNGKLTEADREKALKAYSAYQKGMNAAIDLGEAACQQDKTASEKVRAVADAALQNLMEILQPLLDRGK